jgi:hypothetical protein
MIIFFHFRSKRSGPTDWGLWGELIVRRLKNKINRLKLMSSPRWKNIQMNEDERGKANIAYTILVPLYK